MSQDSSSFQQSNVWFSVSLCLLGVIVGYSIATFTSGPAAPAVPTNPQAAQRSAQPTGPTAVTGPVLPVTAADHIRGNPDAKVSVITYSDFECPFSKRHHPTLGQILDAYKTDVNVVYRHFPLGIHQNAQKEAEASECAAELGGNDIFWKFADAIYDKTTSNGTGFPLAQLPVLAKQLGLDVQKFQQCLDSGKYAQKVKDEEAAGAAAGVRGTPGSIVVLNGSKQTPQLISGAYPFATFKSAIDAMLAKK